MDEYVEYTYADIDAAKEKGILPATFKKRVESYGWSIEKAINTPVKEKRIYDEELRKKANENGISDQLFYSRVRNGFTEEDAANTPLLSRAEAGLRGRKKIRKFTDEQLKIMESNGISLGTARQRVNLYGMTKEEAISRPLDRRRMRRP